MVIEIERTLFGDEWRARIRERPITIGAIQLDHVGYVLIAVAHFSKEVLSCYHLAALEGLVSGRSH